MSTPYGRHRELHACSHPCLHDGQHCFVVSRCYSASDARTLRAAVGALYDLLGLAARTLEAFEPAGP